MKKLILSAVLLSSLAAFAGNDTFQVTGEVKEVDENKIVVLKGKEKERHEIARGTAKVTGGELKVGAKVTVKYTMTAESIEVKEGKAEKPEKKK